MSKSAREHITGEEEPSMGTKTDSPRKEVRWHPKPPGSRPAGSARSRPCRPLAPIPTNRRCATVLEQHGSPSVLSPNVSIGVHTPSKVSRGGHFSKLLQIDSQSGTPIKEKDQVARLSS